eukprot:scaffold2430_cov336-Prasinococcus_capsulatus_cf.AAC.5
MTAPPAPWPRARSRASLRLGSGDRCLLHCAVAVRPPTSHTPPRAKEGAPESEAEGRACAGRARGGSPDGPAQ